jgi:hypothetical protein
LGGGIALAASRLRGVWVVWWVGVSAGKKGFLVVGSFGGDPLAWF